MFKKIIRYVIIIGCLALVVYLFIKPILNKQNAADAATDAEATLSTEGSSGSVSLPVQAQPAFIGDLVIRVSATGVTEPFQVITIVPKISGEIVELPIYEGRNIQKGDLLFRFDDREAKLAINEARGALLRAQGEFGIWNYSRIETQNNLKTSSSNFSEIETRWENAQAKHASGELSDSSLQQARVEFETASVMAGKNQVEVAEASTGLLQARTALEKSQLALAYCEIKAPFAGFVGNLEIANHQFVSAGKECCQLVDLSQVKVAVGVLENEVGFLQPGRKAAVTFPAFPNQVFEGRIETINPVIDPKTRTCRVTVLIPNSQNRIKSGMFAYVKLDAQIFHEKFLVPKPAVLIRDNRKLVFIVREGMAKWCYVETGLENEEYIEVLESKFELKPEELVITDGHFTLIHDAPVRVVEAK
jgi:HlyD family secretion protein